MLRSSNTPTLDGQRFKIPTSVRKQPNSSLLWKPSSRMGIKLVGQCIHNDHINGVICTSSENLPINSHFKSKKETRFIRFSSSITTTRTLTRVIIFSHKIIHSLGALKQSRDPIFCFIMRNWSTVSQNTAYTSL